MLSQEIATWYINGHLVIVLFLLFFVLLQNVAISSFSAISVAMLEYFRFVVLLSGRMISANDIYSNHGGR